MGTGQPHVTMWVYAANSATTIVFIYVGLNYVSGGSLASIVDWIAA